MAKIRVELEASYGCNCMGCGYGSKDTVEIEVNEQELEALRKLGSEEISCKAVVEAIEKGETALQPFHENIEKRFYNMVEEYWLYEADNECLEESLAGAIGDDISEGIFTPSISVDEFLEAVKNEEIDFDGLQFGYFEDIEDNYDLEDEDDVQSLYDSYILNEYYDWVCGNGHDNAFVAERVGLDLDACREDEVNYTITLSV
ncbi:MAG: hypothetical protein IIV24_07525 [Alistipes sp.]|nr:hypothetical protein [Alistipes sp.]